jgi:hypothetical protein
MATYSPLSPAMKKEKELGFTATDQKQITVRPFASKEPKQNKAGKHSFPSRSVMDIGNNDCTPMTRINIKNTSPMVSSNDVTSRQTYVMNAN